MKSLKLELNKSIFEEYVLSTEEMIHVRGGEVEPTPRPSPPPIII